MSKKCVQCENEIQDSYFEIINNYLGRKYICSNCKCSIEYLLDNSFDKSINVIIYHDGEDDE